MWMYVCVSLVSFKVVTRYDEFHHLLLPESLLYLFSDLYLIFISILDLSSKILYMFIILPS